MASFNEFILDYQVQCSNVLFHVDNFSYDEKKDLSYHAAAGWDKGTAEVDRLWRYMCELGPTVSRALSQYER
ncbi:hypothetical protein CDV31_012523 [Fusarium ambrosium]|uniref:Uncharacterized protein n=1 Tax=Fusarium ambrosium TaxID=131363 RepID=A0A428T9A9_9HYPO|nr:hypothetical protein CDV31_012523 [Fusarium ambrosium]